MIIEEKIENFLDTVSKAQSLCEGVRYDWEHHYGGVILYDRQTGRDIFLQPGDDSNQFLEDIKDGDVSNEILQDTIKEYFESIDDEDI